MNVPARVTSFGCRLNAVETEAMVSRADAHGLGDASIVNTCAVTSDAMRKSRAAVRRALRDNPDALVVVSGCASEVLHETFTSLSSRVIVLPNAAKTDADAWMRLPGARPAAVSSLAVRGTTRGFVAVQNGCDHRCTFCIIPFGRGASRSTPAELVVREVRALVEDGASDVTLTGVDLTAWGHDLGARERLGDLVRSILREVPELPRLRLSSLDCIEADDALLDVLANEARLMPHLHLSLQSGDDIILKRMKRRHSRADSVRFCETVRRLRPDVVFGADLIAGFPTETPKMFAQTRALADDCGLTQLHVFPFSARPGTPAARMPAVPAGVVAERAAELREAGRVRLTKHLDAQIGRTLEVLVERGAVGRAADFTPVRVPPALAAGQFSRVTIAGHDCERLLAADAA